MHLVDVAEFYAPAGGGVKTYIDAKLAFAARKGWRVTVLAPGPRDCEEERSGGTVRYIRSPAIPVDRRYHLFRSVAPVHAALDELRPDVVEASSFMLGAWAVATWRGRQAGHAVRALVLHADFVAQHAHTWFGWLLPFSFIDRACFWFWGPLKAIASRFDRVIAGTRWMAGRVWREAGIAAEVVPWGIDLATFRPENRDPALRAELLARLGLPGSARLLVGVGRHHHEKRWPTVFAAVGLAGRVVPVGMVQAGDGFDRARVERAARRAGNVGLLGHVEDRHALARLLASADAFIHGSRAETFGLVASEALASGLPLILPDAGGCTDAAHPAWSETYRAGDARSAAEAILRLAARDPGALSAEAARGRRTRVIDTSEHFERLFALYRGPRPPLGELQTLEPDVALGAAPA
ncbi:glycosyltransferase [Thermaurantiacus sp.]